MKVDTMAWKAPIAVVAAGIASEAVGGGESLRIIVPVLARSRCRNCPRLSSALPCPFSYLSFTFLLFFSSFLLIIKNEKKMQEMVTAMKEKTRATIKLKDVIFFLSGC
ncbi:hypothetical protein S83_011431 [Arachis hypogaea]